MVLKYIYFNRPFKIKGPNGIPVSLNIKYGTCRNILRSLTKKGYIKKPFSVNDGVNKGSSCVVNEKVCEKIFGKTDIINPIEHLDTWTPEHLDIMTPGHLNNRTPKHVDNRTTEHLNNRTLGHVTALNSSSSLYKKLTTKEKFNLNHPELIYWRDLNLKTRQIQKWMDEFDLSNDDIIESLKHCRYDICVNEIEIIKTPFDYFYGRLKKAGFYHPPKNYKSNEEQALEREKERLKRIEAQAQELKDMRLKQQEAEFDLRFQEMMVDPECELYQQCYDQLKPFEKKRGQGRAFEACMRSALKKAIETEGE
jgi:hypothetical protein